MPRFFARIDGANAFISGRDIKHITGPLRKRTGDEIDIREGTQGYRARIIKISRNEIVLDIIEFQQLADRSPRRLNLAVSLIDLKEMDEMIRLASELGVAAIHPVVAERSNVRAVSHARIDRWNEIIKEALKQTQSYRIPVVRESLEMPDFIRKAAACWPGRFYADIEGEMSISEASGEEICLLIGPEGGLSSQEKECLKGYGFKGLSMGNTMLRTLTAAVAAVSILCSKS